MPGVRASSIARARCLEWLREIPRRAICRPARALLVAAVLSLAAALGVLRLELRTDGQALVPPSASEVVYDQSIRQQFGIEDQFVVWVRSGHPDGIFNPGTLELVRELTAEFSRLPGIRPGDVISLATEPSFRMRPRTYQVQHLLDPGLTNKVELDQLREDLRRIQLYSGTLVSTSQTSTVILVGIPSSADRARFYRNICDAIAAHKTAQSQITVTGVPAAELLLGIQILEDLGVPGALLGVHARSLLGPAEEGPLAGFQGFGRWLTGHVGLVPLAVLAMFCVMGLGFRNWVAALLPMPGVAATLLFSFGLMGWCRTPVYLTMAVMPVLLAVLSATNDVYLLHRYLTLLRVRSGAGHLELVSGTFDGLAWPVACTSLTAVIGFLSFSFSPIIPVRMFGVYASIGALYSLFFSLTAVPALLVVLPPQWLFSSSRRENVDAPVGLSTGFALWARGVVRWRWWVAGAGVLVSATTLPGLRHLVVQDSWTNGFAAHSNFRQVTQMVNQDFFGMHLLYVVVDAPRTLAGEEPADSVVPGTLLLPASLVPDEALIEGSELTLSLAGQTPSRSGAQVVWRARIGAAWRQGARLFVRFIPLDSFADFWEAARRAGRVNYQIALQSQLSPAMVRRLANLSAFIGEQRQDAVGGVLGPAEYLLTTRFMARSTDPQARQLADTSAENKWLWSNYAEGLGPQRLRRVIDSSFSRSLTTIFLKDANYVATADLMRKLRLYEREHLAANGMKLGFAGDVAVSQSLIHGIVTTQLQSLIWSLAGIFVVTAWFGGSLRWGFYCLLPSLLAVAIKFAVLGWVGVPLGVATSMFAAMTLGIGVNCAIHLLESYAQARDEGRARPPAFTEATAGKTGTASASCSESAPCHDRFMERTGHPVSAAEFGSRERLMQVLARALAITGPPALLNTVAMSLGIGVLLLSQVPANARLGLLLVLGLINCLVASLVLLPLLLHFWPLDRSKADAGPKKPGQVA